MATKKELESMKQQVIEWNQARIKRVYGNKADSRLNEFNSIEWTTKKIKQWYKDLPQNQVVDYSDHSYNSANFETPTPRTEKEMTELTQNSYQRIYV